MFHRAITPVFHIGVMGTLLTTGILVGNSNVNIVTIFVHSLYLCAQIVANYFTKHLRTNKNVPYNKSIDFDK